MSTAVSGKAVWGRARVILDVLAAAVLSALVLVGCGSDDDDNGGGGGGGGGTPTVTKGTFTDSRDGTSYSSVKIGTQTWMAENLNYNASGSKCYNNSADSCAKYGRLYNWSTAMGGASSSSLSPSGVQGVCPVGWHLPSHDEWTTLTDAVGGASTAGTKLKSTSGWNNNGNGTDQYGWSALPGSSGFLSGSFSDAGNYGIWWSATEGDAGSAIRRSMNYGREDVDWGHYGKDAALYSVRCVAD